MIVYAHIRTWYNLFRDLHRRCFVYVAVGWCIYIYNVQDETLTMCRVILCFIWSIVFLKSPVSGYSAGPPVSTCLTFLPKHGGQDAQFTKPPFTIEIQESSYAPEDDIHITVRGIDGRTFTGIQIAFHRERGDTEEFLGEFIEFPKDKVKTLNCIDGKRNMIGHLNGKPVNEVRVTWKAPQTNEGNLTMFTSIVENFDNFWINLKNRLPSTTNIVWDPQPEITTSIGIQIDFDSCGDTLGCLLYPDYCTGDNCDVGVTFKDEGDRSKFQIFAKQEDGYVSVGFSDDRWMGGDHTISCTVKDGEYTVQHGYNPKLYNYRQYKKKELENMTVAQQDGKLMCEFTRPKVMSVVNMFQPNERLTFDLNQDYYLMIAWGPLQQGSPAVLHHKELPVTTDSKVDFKSTLIYRGSALPQSTQVHALFMVMAWVLLTGIATIVARYFKSSFGTRTFVGAKIWFQVHRTAALLTALLTSASFIVIFVRVDGFTKVAETHAYFGIVLMVTTVLQIIGGLLRPDPAYNFRPIFNWGHWIIGKLSHILAVVSILLAYNIKLIPKTQSQFGTIVSCIWIVFQIIWEGFYEVRKRRRGDSETKDSMKKADIVLLIIYITNMSLVLILSIMAIYFF